MYTIKGAIFDMDGTVIDSMAEWESMRVRFLEQHGIPVEDALATKLLDMTLAQSAAYIKETYDVEETLEEILSEFQSIMRGHFTRGLPTKKGIVDFLKHLRAQGVPCCIASATDPELVELALARSGVREYFDVIFSTKTIGRSKQYPDIYEQAFAYMGTDRAHTWVFEDAAYALRTASAAGFPTVAVYDRYEPLQDEMHARATVYFPDFSVFPSYF